MIRISPTANVMLPPQSIRARFGVEISWSLRYAHTVPNSPTGTEIRNTRRQLIGARMPPSTSPTNMPLTPTMLLIPSAIPRLLAGKASVMIAAELASRQAAPTPCTIRQHDQERGARASVQPVDGQDQRRRGVDDEPEVVDPHPAVHVAEPAEADDQHARHDQEAEDHPQQVEAVAGHQRIEVDAAEDGGHRDQRDRRVERRQQHAERAVRQRDPLVVLAAGIGAPVTRADGAQAAAAVARCWPSTYCTQGYWPRRCPKSDFVCRRNDPAGVPAGSCLNAGSSERRPAARRTARTHVRAVVRAAARPAGRGMTPRPGAVVVVRGGVVDDVVVPLPVEVVDVAASRSPRHRPRSPPWPRPSPAGA